MGIFSLFGKKDRQQVSSPADKNASRKKRDEATQRSSSKGTSNSEAKGTGGDAQVVKRKVVAQATAMKIDAIESEMSSEFVKHALPPVPSKQAGSAVKPAAKPAPARTVERKKTTPVATKTHLPITASLGTTTQFLLGSETIALSVSETTPIVEEAAILFANGQLDMVEHVLQGAIAENNLGNAAPMVWGMLFDLYQVTGQQAQFDHLSIEYANKFETSPPAWIETAADAQASPEPFSGVTPTIPFNGKLDGNIVKQLERVQNLAANNRMLRLEFARVTEVDPVGCGILLSVLKKLQKSGHDLILVGALDLAGKIRTILEVGRRDETEAPWLLLLEILRLLNLEKDFEETSIDYCVTFEVSPPAFVAPQNKVTTGFEEIIASAPESEHFMMPTVIEGRTDKLLHSIATYALQHQPVILDCSRLVRVDFGAVGQLLTGLAPIASNEVSIELHNVNHLVAALFNVMGLKDIVRIVPRKH